MARKLGKAKRPGQRSRQAVTQATAARGAPAAVSRSPLWLRIALPVLIATAAVATYAPALKATFVDWDDDKVIVDNPYIRGLTTEHVHWMFHAYKMGHYHPLTWVSYSIDHAISAHRFDSLDQSERDRYVRGLDPRVFHLHNLLLHAGVAVGFYYLALLLLRVLLPPPADRPDWSTPICAGVAALFFACHPLRVETVAWATERRDVLSSFFLVPCLVFYLRYALAPHRGAVKSACYVASIVLLGLSLMAKAWGMTLPAVMLLLDVYPLRRLGGQTGWITRRAIHTLVEKIPFVALAIFFGYHASAAQRAALGTAKSLSEWGALDRTMQAFYGLFFYSYKTWIPVNLSPLVELPIDNHPFSVRYLAAAGVVMAAAALLIRYRRRWPAGVVAAVCYAGVLSPVLGFHQSGPQLVADRYSYLACLPWALVVGGGLLWLVRRRATAVWAAKVLPAASGAVLVLLPGYALLAHAQARVWQDSKSLWTQVLRVDPGNIMAHTNLGMLLRTSGDIPGAIKHYTTALARKPDDAILLNNLAYAIRMDTSRPPRQRLEDALVYAERAVHSAPKHPDMRYAYGRLLIDLGRFDEGVAELKRSVRLKPKYVKGYRGLAEAFLRRGQKTHDSVMLRQADANYRITLKLEREIDPKSRYVINALDRLARVAELSGRPDAAMGYYRKLLQIDPGNGPAKRGIARIRKATHQP